jgi:hypothetical protein
MVTIKPRLIYIALGLFLLISYNHTFATDTISLSLDVFACRTSSTGDCYYIKWQNHLADTSCDSVLMHYPLYIVKFYARPASGWSLSPSIHIGDNIVGETGSSTLGGTFFIFHKVYTDSLFRSFAGKTVLILPAYPQDPVQKGMFPDSIALSRIDSLVSCGVPLLPTYAEVFDSSTGINANKPSSPNQPSIVRAGVARKRLIEFNLRGQRTGHSEVSGAVILKGRKKITCQ